MVCVILTLQLNCIDGNLDLFGGVKKVGDQVRSDVRKLFEPIFKKKPGNNGTPENKPTGDASKNDAGVNQDIKPVETTTQSVSTTQASATTPVTAATPEVTTTKSVTTTEETGRENFRGSCLPGFQRTNDGRCEPTY